MPSFPEARQAAAAVPHTTRPGDSQALISARLPDCRTESRQGRTRVCALTCLTSLKPPLSRKRTVLVGSGAPVQPGLREHHSRFTAAASEGTGQARGCFSSPVTPEHSRASPSGPSGSQTSPRSLRGRRRAAARPSAAGSGTCRASAQQLPAQLVLPLQQQPHTCRGSDVSVTRLLPHRAAHDAHGDHMTCVGSRWRLCGLKPL